VFSPWSLLLLSGALLSGLGGFLSSPDVPVSVLGLLTRRFEYKKRTLCTLHTTRAYTCRVHTIQPLICIAKVSWWLSADSASEAASLLIARPPDDLSGESLPDCAPCPHHCCLGSSPSPVLPSLLGLYWLFNSVCVWQQTTITDDCVIDLSVSNRCSLAPLSRFSFILESGPRSSISTAPWLLEMR